MKLLSAIKYLSLLFLFTSMSCEKIIIEKTFSIGQESTFRIHQMYTSTDGQNTLQINEISDSRCPEGVECVWAGEVIIKGEWTSNKNKNPFELHSVMKALEIQPDAFTIQIIDAKPYPTIGNVSKPEDLVITLLIQNN